MRERRSREEDAKMKGAIIDEKSFWMIERFGGSITKLRGCVFELRVVKMQIDEELAKEQKKLLGGEGVEVAPEKWKPHEDAELNQDLYQGYWG